jgi:hypothetical protein
MNLKLPAAIAASIALAGGAAACGSTNSDSGTSASSGSSRSQQSAKPVAKITSLSGQSTAVALDSGFVKALQQLKLKPAPVGDATVSQSGVASFPITGGKVTYYKPGTVSPYVQGIIRHQGAGLSLTSAKGTTVKLTNFVVDPGKSLLTGDVSVDGKTAAKGAPLFFLNGNTLQPLKTKPSGKAILQGTTVELKPSAAKLLNKTFGVTALEGGLKIGVAKITLNTAA